MILDETSGPVTIGTGCEIASTAVLIGPLTIGDGVRIGHGCVIGSRGEHRTAKFDPQHPVMVGNGAMLHDHVVVQRGFPTAKRGFPTAIGQDVMLMHGSHVAHNCEVMHHCTLSPFVVLGGHTVLLPWVTMGIHSATHQNVTIGALAMVGMGAMVLRDLPPEVKAVGVPARVIGQNSVGVQRCRDADAYNDSWGALFDDIAGDR